MNDVKVKIKKPTLKDIARKAEMSVSAVSQILNDCEINFCSEEKKQLVKRIAREMNYQTNFGYRVMTGRKTNTTGIVFSLGRLKNEEHITKLCMALSSRFENAGFSVYMATLGMSKEKNFQEILNLVNRGCSSFIFIGASVGMDEMEEYFETNNISYICYDTKNAKRNISVDAGFAIQKVIERFLKEKRNNFKLMLPKSYFIFDDVQGQRIEGLYNAFKDHDKKELIKQYCVTLPTAHSETDLDAMFRMGYDETARLMDKDSSVQGIIYLSDYYALGGARYFYDRGIRIGKEIALCGYNNTQAAHFSPFPISTVDHNIENLCDELVGGLKSKAPLSRLCVPKVVFK